MSVELLDSPRFFGFRVRRQIEGKTYQEYFSLKEGGVRLRGAKRAAVKKAALARDEALATLQRVAREKADREVYVDRSGQVRGILFRLKREKSGTLTPVFQIGVMSRVADKIVNTTVSVNKFGLKDAWLRAVEFYCEHKKISRRSKAYRDLLDAQPKPAELKKLERQAAG